MSSSAVVPFPYKGIDPENWADVTAALVKAHPIPIESLVEATLQSWESIFTSSIGGLNIGEDIFPTPQIMGQFLHELIPFRLATMFPGEWRREQEADEKDLVGILQPAFSMEIKTSSSPRSIFGNRSYAQPDQGTGKKGKSGYYLAVNFQKFMNEGVLPKVVLIRMGWLDHTDWVPQGAPTGQQASLTRASRDSKLLELYPKRDAKLG